VRGGAFLRSGSVCEERVVGGDNIGEYTWIAALRLMGYELYLIDCF
jgi:hypothetical protein